MHSFPYISSFNKRKTVNFFYLINKNWISLLKMMILLIEIKWFYKNIIWNLIIQILYLFSKSLKIEISLSIPSFLDSLKDHLPFLKRKIYFFYHGLFLQGNSFCWPHMEVFSERNHGLIKRIYNPNKLGLFVWRRLTTYQVDKWERDLKKVDNKREKLK